VYFFFRLDQSFLLFGLCRSFCFLNNFACSCFSRDNLGLSDILSNPVTDSGCKKANKNSGKNNLYNYYISPPFVINCQD